MLYCTCKCVYIVSYHYTNYTIKSNTTAYTHKSMCHYFVFVWCTRCVFMDLILSVQRAHILSQIEVETPIVYLRLPSQCLPLFFRWGRGEHKESTQNISEWRVQIVIMEPSLCGHVWTSHPLEANVLTPVLPKKGIYEDEWLPFWRHPSTPVTPVCAC